MSTQVSPVERPELAELRALLESSQCPAHSMNFYQLDGYVRALCTAPGGSASQDWVPLVFNEQEPAYTSADHQRLIHQQLDALYQFHSAQVARNLCNLPCSTVYARLLEARPDIEQWARGFMQGYIVREDEWNNALNWVTNSHMNHKISPNAIYDEFDAILAIVSQVADADYALATGVQEPELVQAFETFANTVVRWGQLGRKLDSKAQTSPEAVAQGLA